MSFLKGRTVRIIINEPREWVYGNLFGTIINDRSVEKIIIKLSKEIKGTKFSSDLLELKPCYEKETFKPLTQNYSVTVNGTLVKEGSDELDPILIGSVTID